MLFLGLCFTQEVQAQLTQFNGKRVAVYVSKKKLSFTPEFNKIFAAYLSTDDSLGLSEEDLKLAFTIRLGTFLTDAFNRELKTDSSYFLNATPGIGERFVKTYATNPAGIWALQGELQRLHTDYVFVVDQMNCYTETRKTVIAVSNQLVPEFRKARLVRLTAHVYEVSTRAEAASIELVFDQERTKPQAKYLSPDGKAVNATTLLTGVFNLALERLFAKF